MSTQSEDFIPDPNRTFPNEYGTSIFLKNIITAPNKPPAHSVGAVTQLIKLFTDIAAVQIRDKRKMFSALFCKTSRGDSPCPVRSAERIRRIHTRVRT